jgi:hypothetical protein
MRRRTWIIFGALVLAAAGVAGGSIVAISLGGDGDTKRPTGQETVLRIEPAQQEVACGPGPVAVFIFLDDLEARPSPLDASASYGISTFQFLLRYDPQIVRVGQAINLELNADLSQADPDGDGLARSFIPVSDVDDFAGRAVLGASSFVPSSPGPENQREEGPDPVANGEPLLLMTVRLLPIGHGTSDLTLTPGTDRLPEFEEPLLLDPAGQRYEPIRLESASLTVEGGDCPEPPPVTPRPTRRPTSTPFVEPTRAPRPTPAPVPGVLASDGGRPDCPQDWYVYNDPDGYFSLCYPADWTGTVGLPPRSDFGFTLSLRSTEGSSLGLYWKESSAFALGLLSNRCESVDHWREVQEVGLTLDDGSVPACVGDATDYAHPNPGGPTRVRGTYADIPIGPEKGFLEFRLREVGTVSRVDSEPLRTIVHSLRIGQ